MKLLPKALLDEEFHYTCNKSKTDLVQDLQKMFSQDSNYNYKKLSGGFISEDKFIVTKQTAPNYPGKRNSIEGKIVPANEKVSVDIVVKSVPYIYLEIFAPILFGLIILGYVYFTYGRIEMEMLLYTLGIILVYPLIMLYVGQMRKDQLRKNFVDALDLSSFN